MDCGGGSLSTPSAAPRNPNKGGSFSAACTPMSDSASGDMTFGASDGTGTGGGVRLQPPLASSNALSTSSECEKNTGVCLCNWWLTDPVMIIYCFKEFLKNNYKKWWNNLQHLCRIFCWTFFANPVFCSFLGFFNGHQISGTSLGVWQTCRQYDIKMSEFGTHALKKWFLLNNRPKFGFKKHTFTLLWIDLQ